MKRHYPRNKLTLFLLSILLTGGCRISFAQSISCQSLFNNTKESIEELTWIKAHESNIPTFSKDQDQLGYLQTHLDRIGNSNFTSACMEILNLTSNRSAWISYIKNIILEVNKTSRDQQIDYSRLEGKLPRHILLRVLVNRSRLRNEAKIIVTPKRVLRSKEFAHYIKHGPFLDIPLRSEGRTNEHGMDTHFVQRDFINI